MATLASRMSRRTLLIAGGILLLLALVPDIAARLRGHTPENRHELYALRSSIYPGMPRSALDQLLREKADNDKMGHTWVTPDQVTIWAPVGFMEAYSLFVDLREDSVVHATIQDENGEKLETSDAPPDF